MTEDLENRWTRRNSIIEISMFAMIVPGDTICVCELYTPVQTTTSAPFPIFLYFPASFAWINNTSRGDYPRTHDHARALPSPAKNFFVSKHFSLLHPGHLSPICLEHEMPLSR